MTLQLCRTVQLELCVQEVVLPQLRVCKAQLPEPNQLNIMSAFLVLEDPTVKMELSLQPQELKTACCFLSITAYLATEGHISLQLGANSMQEQLRLFLCATSKMTPSQAPMTSSVLMALLRLVQAITPSLVVQAVLISNSAQTVEQTMLKQPALLKCA